MAREHIVGTELGSLSKRLVIAATYPRLSLCRSKCLGEPRFIVEYFREPDSQLGLLPWGLSMGQTLSAPMILVGIWFIATASKRRVRVEPIAGSASVA